MKNHNNNNKLSRINEMDQIVVFVVLLAIISILFFGCCCLVVFFTNWDFATTHNLERKIFFSLIKEFCFLIQSQFFFPRREKPFEPGDSRTGSKLTFSGNHNPFFVTKLRQNCHSIHSISPQFNYITNHINFVCKRIINSTKNDVM